MNQFCKHLAALLYLTYGPNEVLNDKFCSDILNFIVPSFSLFY